MPLEADTLDLRLLPHASPVGYQCEAYSVLSETLESFYRTRKQLDLLVVEVSVGPADYTCKFQKIESQSTKGLADYADGGPGQVGSPRSMTVLVRPVPLLCAANLPQEMIDVDGGYSGHGFLTCETTACLGAALGADDGVVQVDEYGPGLVHRPTAVIGRIELNWKRGDVKTRPYVPILSLEFEARVKRSSGLFLVQTSDRIG